MYTSTHCGSEAPNAPKEVKKPLNLPFLKPLVAPASMSKCTYLLGAEATTPYNVYVSLLSCSGGAMRQPPSLSRMEAHSCALSLRSQ